MRIWVKARVLCLGVVLSSCQSGEIYLTTELHARVVSAATREPIRGATVIVWPSGNEKYAQVTATDYNGYAYLPRLKGNADILFPFVADPIPPSTKARFEAKGYVPAEIDSYRGRAYFTGSIPVELVPEPR